MKRAFRINHIVCRNPRATRLLIAIVLTTTLAGVPLAAAEMDSADTCLVVSAENIVTGPGNWYAYVQFSAKRHTIQSGDHLEYDILLPALNPELKGGIDADLDPDGLPPATATHPELRDCNLRDQDGLRLHGDAILEPARDKWYHRRFDLAALAGCTASCWTVAFEGDQPGRYVQLLDNIRITRAGQTVATIYDDGPAPEVELRLCNGYSRTVLITSAARSDALADPQAAKVLEQARRENEFRSARARFHQEMEVARELGRRLDDPELLAEIDEAVALEDEGAYESRDADAYFASLHRARHQLGHAHAQMQRFTGHLVGHAHIDLQWLWTWDETTDQIIPQTFGQALEFMKEFPDFTFSQSSAALYRATEQHHPELFKQIQQRVAEGRWEIVGGRWCEGDTNMISPESHARHLLYGQRYFQSRFGRICNVGWEPDTFGHCWTLPQILKKGGIDYYYFCRAGQGVPLFWWEGPDGSRVLTFEEPATGGWYNDVVSDDKVRELARFVLGANAFDHLMVYGVGNHGGGPTREYIQAALAMRDRSPWPNVRFSTAGEFFRRLGEHADELTIPTVRDELNPVFEGCYTTHSRIKRYNRDSETLLESAEVFAALASLRPGGPAYPREAFEDMWRNVLWNHHHDTLPGSFIHASAIYSAKMYDQLIERGTGILQRSQQALAEQIDTPSDGPHVVVFNPLAWPRSEIVEVTLQVPVTERFTTLYDNEGDVPVQILDRELEDDRVTLRICFLARNIPGCGFKVFRNRGPAARSPAPVTEQTLDEVYRVSVDANAVQPSTNRIHPRFQILHENPHGMSAWTLGAIDQTSELGAPVSTETIESGPLRHRSRSIYRFDRSTIAQDTIHYSHSPRVDYETTIYWEQVGNATDGGPMLKVAFPTGIEAESATYEIPFGDVSRKNDGHENVALKWCAVSGAATETAAGALRTVALLSDCKHAYDVKDNVIRLTLLRSSYEPDPTPDVGVHRIRYAALPTDGPLDKAAVARAAWEFNKPLQVLVRGYGKHLPSVARDPATPPLPVEWSGCESSPANVIVTALKLAEDNDDLIIRAYECAGQKSTATFSLGFPCKSVTETDLLEREMPNANQPSLTGPTITAQLEPYEIRTFRVKR